MSNDPFQPAPTDPTGRPAPPAGSPFGSPPAASTGPDSGVPSGAPGAIGAPAVEPGSVAVRSRRGGGGGMLINVLLGTALVVAIGGVAFAVGRATAPVTTAAAGRTGTGADQGGGFFRPNASGAPGRGGFGGGGGLAGAVSVQGTVEAIDGSSITIKTASGTTVTLGLNGDTSYHKQAAATAADVTTGSTVIVQLEGRGLGNGRPSASGAPGASGAPAAGFGTAGSVTIVP